MKKEIVIIGGSLGGVIAAIRACQEGHSVVMTEETDWIGGQVTSQGVPFDENKWIETVGGTESYQKFRTDIRKYYQEHFDLKDSVKVDSNFNPGNGWVTRLSCEPKIALEILKGYLKPYEENGLCTILYHTVAISSIVENHSIQSVRVKNLDTKKEEDLYGIYYLDATDEGDLLPLSQTHYFIGSESYEDYKEPHAPIKGDKEDLQPVTFVCAIGYHPGEHHKSQKPALYDTYRNYIIEEIQKPLFGWINIALNNKGFVRRKLLGPWNENGETVVSLYDYRQIYRPDIFKHPTKNYTITLLNWPQNDYFFHNILETEDNEKYILEAKELTKSLVYWLQTEAPRHDGMGVGYPEIDYERDIFDTEDGFAKVPYIREGRRLDALKMITENEISKKLQPSMPHFSDSVGIGHYNIDVHYTTKEHNYFFEETWPFEIPLGAMIPKETTNLIPACKNIGTTHITNGCFRLHPVEWNVGEVSGLLASFCIKNDVSMKEVYENSNILQEFQKMLDSKGIRRSWPKDLFSQKENK